MSKYGEIVALAETFMKLGAEKAKAMATPAPRRREEKKEKDVDVLALLEQKRREYLALKNFVEEQHKLSKPEKKEEKKPWLTPWEAAMVVFALSPFIGAFSFLLLRALLNL